MKSSAVCRQASAWSPPASSCWIRKASCARRSKKCAVRRLRRHDNDACHKRSGTAPHAANAEPKPLVYVCPMPEHVSITYDHPGNCPICGMALVPVTPAEAQTTSARRQGALLHLPDAGARERSRGQTGQMPDLRHDAHSRDGASGRSHQFNAGKYRFSNPTVHQSANPKRGHKSRASEHQFCFQCKTGCKTALFLPDASRGDFG